MKYLFLLLFISGSALAQTTPNPDYTPLPVRPDSTAPASLQSEIWRPVSSNATDRILADPELSTRRQHTRQVLLGPGSEHYRQRWYLAAEGNIRHDVGQLSSTLNGLIATEGITKFGWGVAAGVVLREQWNLELAYGHQPIHTNLLIRNGRSPIALRSVNRGNSLLLRGKVRVGRPSRMSNGDGLWLGGSIGVIPNVGQLVDSTAFRGFSYQGRSQTTTFLLLVDSRTNPRWSGLAEASADYVFRLGGATELTLFIRRSWALGYSLQTRINYQVNRSDQQQATLNSGGQGWTMGITLRHSYAMRH